MNNIQGYILGIVSCIVYTIFDNLNNLSYKIFPEFTGLLIFCILVSLIVKLFYRGQKFGITFGYTTLIVSLLEWVGFHSNSKYLGVFISLVILVALIWYRLVTKKNK